MAVQNDIVGLSNAGKDMKSCLADMELMMRDIAAAVGVISPTQEVGRGQEKGKGGEEEETKLLDATSNPVAESQDHTTEEDSKKQVARDKLAIP